MPDTILSGSARRYATAAFAVAQEAGTTDGWLSLLDRAAQIMRLPTAHTVFHSPLVSAEDKQAALDKVLPGMPPTERNFLFILAERGRLDELPQIASAFRQLVYRERDIVPVEVTTAVPVDQTVQAALAQRLGAYLRHDPSRLVLEPHVDPAIIGGVIARVGDTLIDDSIRGRLQRLRQALAAGR